MVRFDDITKLGVLVLGLFLVLVFGPFISDNISANGLYPGGNAESPVVSKSEYSTNPVIFYHKSYHVLNSMVWNGS